MPIVAKTSGGTSFEPAPAGVHSAVCVDVIDMGVLEVTYSGKTKKQHKIRIVWQIGENRDDGKPYIIQKRYTLSLHEKAKLREDLENWRGRPFTRDEENGFDVETVIGAPCMLNLIREMSSGQEYTNIKAITQLPKGMVKLTPRDYIRTIDRKPEDAQQQSDPPPTSQSFGEVTDDDIPF